MLMQLLPNPFIVPVGLAIGVLVAAPVGPVNVLCIQRAIERGVWGGVAAGFGAVLGDGLIALSAALGVSAVTGLIATHGGVLQVIGGLALIVFAVRLCFSEPRLRMSFEQPLPRQGLAAYAWDVPKTLFLTLTNPGAVLGLFAIFSGISTFVEVRTTIEALLMVAAVMVGSLIWWVALSSFVGRFRRRFDGRRLVQINRVAGALLLVFGLMLIGEITWQALVRR